jgi:hypothetical protein
LLAAYESDLIPLWGYREVTQIKAVLAVSCWSEVNASIRLAQPNQAQTFAIIEQDGIGIAEVLSIGV